MEAGQMKEVCIN